MIVTFRFRCPICQDESSVSGMSTPLLEKALERGVCEVVCATCDKEQAADRGKEADDIVRTLAQQEHAQLSDSWNTLKSKMAIDELIRRARKYVLP